MKLEEIINKIQLNGGITLNKDLKESEEKKGFYVSKIGFEKIINIKDLASYLSIYKKMILKNEYIGLWIDNNKLYIDISKHYKNKKESIKKGVQNKQLAIYDIENNKSIYLYKTTYILYQYIRVKNNIGFYLSEYYDINDLKNRFKDIKNIYQYINESLDKNNIHILKDRYIIVKDSMLYKEYIDIMEG